MAYNNSSAPNRMTKAGSIFTEQTQQHLDRSGEIETLVRETVTGSPHMQGFIREMRNHDEYTAAHGVRVMAIALYVFKQLGSISDEALRQRAAIIGPHDVGKLFIDPAVLSKADPLTPEEWTWIKQHPIYGGRILRAQEAGEGVVQFADYHHVNKACNPYPALPKDKEVVFTTDQSIGVFADMFDAHTSGRSYMTPRDPRVVKNKVIAGDYRGFDKHLIKLLPNEPVQLNSNFLDLLVTKADLDIPYRRADLEHLVEHDMPYLRLETPPETPVYTSNT